MFQTKISLEKEGKKFGFVSAFLFLLLFVVVDLFFAVFLFMFCLFLSCLFLFLLFYFVLFNFCFCFVLVCFFVFVCLFFFSLLFFFTFFSVLSFFSKSRIGRVHVLNFVYNVLCLFCYSYVQRLAQFFELDQVSAPATTGQFSPEQ